MNEDAPTGKVFVCAMCGNTSRDRYGYKKISPGWDESCMLNAVLVDEKPEEQPRADDEDGEYPLDRGDG